MATDFSIDALLNSPTKKSRNVTEHRIEEIPVPGRVFTPIVSLDSNDTCSSILREPIDYHRTISHQKLPTSIDLTRYPAADFATIVMPKKQTKPRRKRTAFSNIQLHFLEQFFQKKAYPSSQERNFIGSILNIGSGQVKTWYQNRRTKMKKNKVFDLGMENEESGNLEVNRLGNDQLPTTAPISNTFESNVKCFDFGNKQPFPITAANLDGKNSMPELSHCDCYKPICIGRDVLLEPPKMISQHR